MSYFRKRTTRSITKTSKSKVPERFIPLKQKAVGWYWLLSAEDVGFSTVRTMEKGNEQQQNSDKTKRSNPPWYCKDRDSTSSSSSAAASASAVTTMAMATTATAAAAATTRIPSRPKRSRDDTTTETATGDASRPRTIKQPTTTTTQQSSWSSLRAEDGSYVTVSGPSSPDKTIGRNHWESTESPPSTMVDGKDHNVFNVVSPSVDERNNDCNLDDFSLDEDEEDDYSSNDDSDSDIHDEEDSAIGEDDDCETSWEETFRLFAAQKKQQESTASANNNNNNITIVPNRGDLEDWVFYQRHRYRIGKLSKERFSRLESIDFEWSLVKETDWLKMYDTLVAFKKKHNMVDNIPEASLGKWVPLQRSNYKDGKLTEERIALLESIGFEWQSKKLAN